MKKNVVIILVFLFLGILILTLVLDAEKLMNKIQTPSNNPESPEMQDKSNLKEDSLKLNNQEPSTINEEKNLFSSDSSNGGGSISGSDSGSGGVSTNTEEENLDSDSDFEDPTISCTTQISYAVGIINEQKTTDGINCSLKVRNLEYETSGDFIINLILLDENLNKIETIESSKMIEPRQEEEFFYFFEGAISSNKCRYETVSIPKKEVC